MVNVEESNTTLIPTKTPPTPSSKLGGPWGIGGFGGGEAYE